MSYYHPEEPDLVVIGCKFVIGFALGYLLMQGLFG